MTPARAFVEPCHEFVLLNSRKMIIWDGKLILSRSLEFQYFLTNGTGTSICKTARIRLFVEM